MHESSNEIRAGRDSPNPQVSQAREYAAGRRGRREPRQRPRVHTGGAGGVKITSLSGSCPWPAVNLASARRSFRSFHWRRFACGRWSGLAWIWSRGGGGCRRPSGCCLPRVGRCLSSIQHHLIFTDPLSLYLHLWKRLWLLRHHRTHHRISTKRSVASRVPMRPRCLDLRPEASGERRRGARREIRSEWREREQTSRFFMRLWLICGEF